MEKDFENEQLATKKCSKSAKSFSNFENSS